MGHYEQHDIDAWLDSQTSWVCHLSRLSTCVSYFCVAMTQKLGRNNLREERIHFGSQCVRGSRPTMAGKTKQNSSVDSTWSVQWSLVHRGVKQEAERAVGIGDKCNHQRLALIIFFGQMGVTP